jgi:hypothetical protein
MRRTSKTPNLQSIFWSQIWKFSSNSSHPDSILAWSRTSFISVTSNWSTHIVCWISSRYGLRNLQFSVFYAVWALTLSIVALTSCIGESTVVKSHRMIWFYEFKGGVFCLFPMIDKRSWRIEYSGSVNHKVAEAWTFDTCPKSCPQKSNNSEVCRAQGWATNSISKCKDKKEANF